MKQMDLGDFLEYKEVIVFVWSDGWDGFDWFGDLNFRWCKSIVMFWDFKFWGFVEWCYLNLLKFFWWGLF